jgi:2,4-dienoyl-CoA reductase-like NADH-dependent reductase (Old Yellow Enzyme family)
MSAYPHLFSSFAVKNTVIPNRIFMPPMGTNLANVDGTPGEQQMRYYALRAEGGAGLITIENVCIDYPLGTNGTTQLRFDNDQCLPGFYRLVEGMQAFGACVSV